MVGGLGSLSGYALTYYNNLQKSGFFQSSLYTNSIPEAIQTVPGYAQNLSVDQVIQIKNQEALLNTKTDTAHAMAPVVSNPTELPTGLLVVGAIVAAFLLFKSR